MKLKQWENIFHVIVNAKSVVQHLIEIKNGIIKHVIVIVKIFRSAKKDYSWNPSTCICENSKYLKSMADTSVITCDEIISVMKIVSTKMTNTIGTNVTKNCRSQKVRHKFYCYILHTVLLGIILLLIITIICYHYAKHRSKQKSIDVLTIYKWRIMNFKKFVLKIVCVITSMTWLN